MQPTGGGRNVMHEESEFVGGGYGSESHRISRMLESLLWLSI